MKRWLSIVGIGDDGLEGLAPAARRLIDRAEVLVGGERHLAMLPDDDREKLTWPTPLVGLIDDIKAHRGRRVCVMATGNPMFYGVGVTLARHIPIEEMEVVPAPSAFALACARLGWSQADVETLTLHGRPPESIHAYIQPDVRLLILSYDGSTPARVAELLRGCGYEESRMWVLEHMGGKDEKVLSGTAAEWPSQVTADLNTVAVECVAGATAELMARTPGLPDEAFRHDGQLTKREIRAATLAALLPMSGQHLWDVGAGCGSVGIEWMRAARGTRASAVERNRARVRFISENAVALGTPLLKVVEGTAPEALAGLDAPDAVFIGGGASAAGLFEACWEALQTGGRLVANAVTVEGEQALFAWHKEVGGELTRISISQASPVGRYQGWRPMMPVTQFSVVKS
jgi:precorrin-6Y C5,15-methyltransferase (decarboxylating)